MVLVLPFLSALEGALYSCSSKPFFPGTEEGFYASTCGFAVGPERQTCKRLGGKLRLSDVVQCPVSFVIMEQSASCFQSEHDFCPECGTVLPLPGIQDKVTCLCCSFSIDIREFEGRETHTSITFSTIDATSERKMDEGKEIKGPLIDRNCPQCGHEGMVYHTRQMRSADEGQTVFYTCPRCKFQEKEDS